jgi:two-component system response regulator DegU
MKPIKVLLVDDQQLVREGLRRMMDIEDDIRVIGEASSGEEAIVKAKDLAPDVILMDIRMRGMNGIEATRQLKEQGCSAKVIILTIYEDKYLEQSAEAGAIGYLLKDLDREDLAKAIRLAHAGQSPFAPPIASSLLKQYTKMVAVNRKNVLTGRQLDVLRLIASGDSNKNIAQKLYLSEATIKRESSSIFARLGATDRANAVAEAYAKNLL